MVKKIEYIDFARGYAILSIVLYHYLVSYDFGKWINLAIFFGGTGIHLFFFLSGFSLNLSSKFSANDFYKKRLIKIYFPYFIIITIIYIINEIYPLYQDAIFTTYLSHIFLYKMFSNDLINSMGGHFWFISTIIQFYIFFPFLRKLQHLLGSNTFVILSICLSLIHLILIVYFELYGRHISSIFTQYLWEFALGMHFATLYKSRGYEFWNLSLKKYIYLLALTLPIMGLLTLKFNEVGVVLNDFSAFIAYTALNLIFFHILNKYAAHLSIYFKALGYISYSLYLIHMIVLHVGEKLFISTNLNYPIVFLPLIFFLTCWLSILFDKFTTFFINVIFLKQKKYSTLQ